MSDMSIEEIEAERRANCKDNHLKIHEMFSWYKGNGNPGASTRLIVLENLANGKGETASMAKINSHINRHDKMDKRRWDLTVGIILILITQVVTIILNRGGL